MNIYDKELIEGLQTGLIDHLLQSKIEYVPQLLINDKINGKKILTTIQNDLSECKEFYFSVAFVTMSGVTSLINTLQDLESRRIKGRILVSQYQNFTEPEALRQLLKFKNIELKIVVFGDFHAKGYLFKKVLGYDIIIGSSNWTGNALSTNKEWNLKVSATTKGKLINNIIYEFKTEFRNAEVVNHDFINKYEIIYNAQKQILKSSKKQLESLAIKNFSPNLMQIEALTNLKELRAKNKNKALLISATGTGKTFLSAFDVKQVNPRTFLFIVHRENISRAAMDTFKTIFGNTKTIGLFTGNLKEIDSNFIFSTIQTISRDDNLQKFEKDYFDYIVVDETHRAGADSYQKVISYFKPKFLLGMTATPERTDGLDIFKTFDHNIAYEIRLHKALEAEMLSNFHYFGIVDLVVNDQLIDENTSFNLLTSDERVNRIIEKANFYSCDNGIVRGLVFCSKVEECEKLSELFNKRGLRSIALSGGSSEIERSLAIESLESENHDKKIDYIFTVDIFNEGIDIPKVNQIILLRPTQSAIIFVQQLGRGLRKCEGKEYLTVIDFIGNYSNNYMVPIALFGDTSYNKDTLRKLLNGGSSLIPGASTINFDRIAKERIYASIDNAKLNTKKDLVKDYNLLKFEIGRNPLMMDFLLHGSRDPYLFVKHSKSYFSFVKTIDIELYSVLGKDAEILLQLFSNNPLDGKRVEEVIILEQLFTKGKVSIPTFKKIISTKYGYEVKSETLNSVIRSINCDFIGRHKDIIRVNKGIISHTPYFVDLLKNKIFNIYYRDLLDYALFTFNSKFEKNKYRDGFILYEKYSRKDVVRILNWDTNPPPINVSGYVIHAEKTSCPLFVTYHKKKGISNTIKYEDKFISNHILEWISKNNRNLKSSDVVEINDSKRNHLRLPLFIKKHDPEGDNFYFISDLTPDPNKQPTQSTIVDDEGKELPIVKFNFILTDPVEDSLYEYLTSFE